MGTRGIGGAQAMRCWEQLIEKEENTRLNWHDKKKSGELDQTQRSKQYEVFRRRIALNGPTISEELLNKLPKVKGARNFHRRKPKYRNALVENVDPNSIDSDANIEMYKPPPDVLETLYDGFTKEEKGRYRYLQSRQRVIPERKYQFPLLSSWDYGWRLSDVIKTDDLHKPTYGRTKLINDTFYTRNEVPDLAQPCLYRSYTNMF